MASPELAMRILAGAGEFVFHYTMDNGTLASRSLSTPRDTCQPSPKNIFLEMYCFMPQESRVSGASSLYWLLLKFVAKVYVTWLCLTRESWWHWR